MTVIASFSLSVRTAMAALTPPFPSIPRKTDSRLRPAQGKLEDASTQNFLLVKMILPVFALVDPPLQLDTFALND